MTERIRVLRVIARANVGGPAVQVRSLTAGLDPTRFESRLLVGAVGEDETDYLSLVDSDLPLTRIRGLGRDPSPTADVRALMAIRRHVSEFRPHIVHTHTAKAGVLGRIAAITRRRRPATVHTFHGHVLRGYFSPWTTRLIVTVERTLARVTTRLVAEGERVRDELLAAGIGRPDQYVVVPPGIALPGPPTRAQARRMLGLPVGGTVVAFVARLTTIKRPDRFGEVALALAARRSDTMFLVAGEGELLGDLRLRLAPLGGRVAFVGFRPDVEVVYAAADVVLLTSDNEGMPYSLVEAALAGCPVVATDVGSVSEVVVDRETGYITRPEAAELVGALEQVLADPSGAEQMGRSAAERARRVFGAERLIADAEALYTDLYRGGDRSGAPEGDPRS